MGFCGDSFLLIEVMGQVGSFEFIELTSPNQRSVTTGSKTDGTLKECSLLHDKLSTIQMGLGTKPKSKNA